MKRALLLLPLIALVAGMLILLLRGRLGISGPSSNPAASGGTVESANPGSPRPATGGAAAPLPAPAPGTAQIQFTVTSRGVPLEKAKIIVQKQGTDAFNTYTTDAKGSLLLLGLPAQDYGILIEHPDHLPFGTEAHPTAGQTVPIAVDLKQGGRIYGTVTDKAGHPLPNTRVLLLGAESSGPVQHNQISTDEQGKYVIRAVPPGNFGVRFRHKLFKPLDRLNLFFRSHTDEYKVDVTLEVGARLAGRVLDPEGKPVEGALVQAGNKGSAQLEKTDRDGRFSLGGLNDLPVNCTVSKEGYGKVILRSHPVNGPDIEVRLALGGTVAGRVVVDEAPRQVQVTLSKYDDDLRQVVMTDSRFFPDPPKGEFALPDVPPGTYWVDVAIDGYEALERPQVIVASGQTVQGIVVTFRKKS